MRSFFRSMAESRSERRSRKRRPNDVYGGEYTVVALRISWGLLSIACFLLALPTRYWIRWLPFRPEYDWLYPRWIVTAIGILSATGTVCGLVGVWLGEQKGASKLGLVANGLVLGLVGLTILGMRWILNR